MANPFPFVAGSVLEAAQLNGIGEAWTSYTPTVTQGVAVTATVNEARYARVNKIVIVKAHLSLTSAGTASSVIVCSLPTGLNAVNTTGVFRPTAGLGLFYDTSTTTQYLLGCQASAGGMQFVSDVVGGNNFGATPAVTIANGDFLAFTITYEVA
jgi:hypothetical protein